MLGIDFPMIVAPMFLVSNKEMFETQNLSGCNSRVIHCDLRGRCFPALPNLDFWVDVFESCRNDEDVGCGHWPSFGTRRSLGRFADPDRDDDSDGSLLKQSSLFSQKSLRRMMCARLPCFDAYRCARLKIISNIIPLRAAPRRKDINSETWSHKFSIHVFCKRSQVTKKRIPNF